MKIFQRRKPRGTSTRADVANERYIAAVEEIIQNHSLDRAMGLAVGGEFEAMGKLEVAALKHFGLKDDEYLIDVGCGSGRLAQPLSRTFQGKYLGIDVVPPLIDFARQSVRRPDWRFEVTEGLTIPEKDSVADMVCFFSVFTHLSHEQSYLYLKEAKRVLKPGGKILFSFLDFAVPSHWHVFEAAIGGLSSGTQPLIVFLNKEAIPVWASHLGLTVQSIQDGDKATIPLQEPVVFEKGSVMTGLGTLGQSLCVLSDQQAT
jgi:ubiquinone/menaquinone biosynthesis C-methylase UbiE